MAIAYRTIQSALLATALVLGAAGSACAAVQTNDNPPPAAESGAIPASATVPAISWQEQSVQTAGAETTATLTTHTALTSGQQAQLLHQLQDRNLDDSTTSRFDIEQVDSFLSEYWWQAVPGIAVMVFLALAMYMRAPIQRKRKYRSTPHEPTGSYRRRRR